MDEVCPPFKKYGPEIKKRDFVDAAIVSGGSSAHILWVHILPNILPLMVITAAADIGAMMMELAGLSFLGFGSQPPAPEWGLMLNEGRQQLQTAPWLMISRGLLFYNRCRFQSVGRFSPGCPGSAPGLINMVPIRRDGFCRRSAYVTGFA